MLLSMLLVYQANAFMDDRYCDMNPSHCPKFYKALRNKLAAKVSSLVVGHTFMRANLHYKLLDLILLESLARLRGLIFFRISSTDKKP